MKQTSKPWHSSEVDEVLHALNAKKDGLSQEEAQKRLQEFGPNELKKEEQKSPVKLFLEQFKDVLVIILLAGLRSIPVEPTEAAVVDGASKWQVFARIILPLLTPQILIVLLIRGMDIFKTFDFIYSLTFGGPGQSTTLVSFRIYRQAFVQFKLGYGAALSWVTFVIIYIIAFLILKFVKPRELTV